MHIAVVQFPGSNCEHETLLAVKRAGMIPLEFLWNESPEKLLNCQGYIIAGRFSEDGLRVGAMAALDPVMQVIRQQSERGKPVLGICNGARILVEAGLVPGIENHKAGMALTENQRIQQGQVVGTGYYNAWVQIRLSDDYQYNAFTRLLKPNQVLRLRVSHAEGRFVIPPALLLEMQINGLNVFQYCDVKGEVTNEFPINPNGSINNIAAVSNKNGNVLAMMPHPECTEEGDIILTSMREYIVEGYKQQAQPLCYYPRPMEIKKYDSCLPQLIVDLMKVDHHALSVQNELKKLHIQAKIKRQIHWEIECDSMETFEAIKASGVLYNHPHEFIAATLPTVSQGTQQPRLTLVRAKDDIYGLQKMQLLKNHFGIEGIKSIKYGVLWHILAEEDDFKKVLATRLLFNPVAQECYHYA
jgi:phosphoribosylformylglycinamidine synthase subunit PurQ / glutaminase